jgi:hypothetical protein
VPAASTLPRTSLPGFRDLYPRLPLTIGAARNNNINFEARDTPVLAATMTPTIVAVATGPRLTKSYKRDKAIRQNHNPTI